MIYSDNYLRFDDISSLETLREMTLEDTEVVIIDDVVYYYVPGNRRRICRKISQLCDTS